MRRDIGFLLVGLASGFLLASLLRRLREEAHPEDADELATRISERLEVLESEFASV